VTPEKTDRGKPFPEPLFYSAEKLSLNLNEILFIGDMHSDMLCAQNAKTLYLHYLEGYQKLENQIYGGEINSLMQIEEYINFL
jgi:phosphoglycolate phosphatase-like HAD superfamily hydrolase